ncbi:hypothetical protein RCG24_19565 [Neobacillus sp. OS1-32]|uniref:hypothetical protein n=1 Tax=Neobacillus sp. OS1-32 TaxID=3070682 RepID=UPI0027E067D7|nr:hypothetical protein [Neobacillus sp. OS1-32]WML32554.1 hypothetical protein RCG24_19565 [Neobacillus sp. OS1-32]
MKVSSKGEYALRALLLLGNHQGKVLGIQEIADQNIGNNQLFGADPPPAQKAGLLS